MKPNKPLSDKEVIALLGKMKGTPAQYPPDLLAARKAAFMKQVGAVAPPGGPGSSGAQGGAQGGATTSGSPVSGIPPAPHMLETILQAVLGGMVTVAVATGAYVYRDQIKDFFQADNTDARVVNTAPATEVVLPSIFETATELPSVTPTYNLATPPTPGRSPKPGETDVPPTDVPPTDVPPTDVPPTPTKPGNHYGQTRTPRPSKTPKP